MQQIIKVWCIYAQVALTEINTIGEESEFHFQQWNEVSLSTASTLDLGPTRTPNHWVPGTLSPGIK
jgi:hypothetical protein